MKTHLVALLTIGMLYACTKSPISDPLTNKIQEVESNLIPSVLIEGDSTWTIEERMEHYGVPGVSIAVIDQGEIAWTKTYGVINKETKVPVEHTTLFQAGSISKPVAAYGALRLVEKKAIDLNEDVNAYLTSWKLPESEFMSTKKVTLKNLLNHSGGITVHGFLGYSPDLEVPSLEAVLNGTAPANSSAIFNNKTPEESFRYSGGGYTIMQQMVIDVEGKEFPKVMKELVLEPLAMTNSTYDQPLQEAQLKMAATGYLPDGSMTKGERHTYPEMAAAGLWTNAEDLAKFALNIQKTMKGESNKVLSQEMTTNMLTPFVEDFIGLGIFINKMKDEVYFGHGGWDEGFSSELVAHKDKGYGVVVLTNSNHPAFISELIRSVALTYKWDDYVQSYEKMALGSSNVAELEGRYLINNNRLVEVYEKEDKLYSRLLGKESMELIKISDSTFTWRERHQFVQFKLNPENDTFEMQIADPNNESSSMNFKKMNADEKIPLEYLVQGAFDEGLKAYKALMEKDKNDPTINEGNLNSLGYSYLNDESMKLAQDIFKVNMKLYSNSAKVYDSYAEACMKTGAIELAIKNYKKAFSMDPQNLNAEAMVKELEKKKENE